MTTDPPALVAWLATLSDLARLRICRLLSSEELSVGELARALQLPQSTVSRHLKVLHDGGWIEKRAAGTASYYQMGTDRLDADARDLWALLQGRLGGTAVFEEDGVRAQAVLAERSLDSRAFFGRVGGEWDELRRELFGSGFTARGLLALLSPQWTVADLGCGTGNAADRLAPWVAKVIAVDREPAMLDAAAKRLAHFDNVEFRVGDLLDLPLADDEVDASTAFLVLHHLDAPGTAVAEMARVVRPDGRILIVDMVRHDRDEYRRSMGHRQLGFDESDVAGWAKANGRKLARWQRLPVDSAGKGPGLFTAMLT